MKNLVFRYVILLSVLFFFSCDFLKFENENLQEPNLIKFENQKVLLKYDWSLIGLNGKPFNFITKQKKNVFVYFWDETCDDCLNDLKKFNEFYDKYKMKFDFLIITNLKQAKVREVLRDNDFYFPVYFSLSPFPKPLISVPGPRSYIINKKGRIMMENDKCVNWSSVNFIYFVDKLSDI